VRRLLDYYRQFQELSPEEVSRQLRERRAAERARALAEIPIVDLSSPAWYEPPDPEAVNAATYALRRSLNTYPDAAELREAIAARHGVEAAQVAAGHGAGALLAAALRMVAPGGEAAVAWPGWVPLPQLAREAGAEPVPVPLADGAPDADGLLAVAGRRTRAVVLCTPNDPTGGTVAAGDLRRLAERLPEQVWLIVDAALAEFEPGTGDDAAGDRPTPAAGPREHTHRALLAAREQVVVVRSVSKAHAMAGLRAGYALAGSAEVAAPLAAPGGLPAPAQAAMLWTVREGDAVVARRRAAAARERERLAAALRGTPFSFPTGHGHLVWLRSDAHAGDAIADHLARRRIRVAGGRAWGDDRHVRVALGRPAATDRLIAALSELARGTRRA
jgi:histidinol-phosphate aminotransferase